jgi:hypothetical protein
VIGGTGATGTVYLAGGVAGPQGINIGLSTTSNKVILTDTSVTIQPYDSCANFWIQTSTVSNTLPTNIITAQQYGTGSTGSIQITTPPLSSIQINPNEVVGGSTSTGSVYLTGGVAGSPGIVIDISYSSTHLTNIPTTITIPTGNNSANFTINTTSITTPEIARITASKNGISVYNNITLNPPGISSITINPSTIIAGLNGQATGTIYLSGGVAGIGGIVIDLSSSSPNLIIPNTTTIASGTNYSTFIIQSSPIPSNETDTITASYNNTFTQGTINLIIPSLSTFTIQPKTILGGLSSVGSVYLLNGIAGSPGIQVNLSSNDTANEINIPPFITIPTNDSSASFPITSVSVNTNRTYTINAYTTQNSLSNTINILPPTLQSISISPRTIQGGNTTQGTVVLTTPAPTTSNIIVQLSCNNSNITIPSTTTILSNTSSSVFTITTLPVAIPTVVIITATFQNSTVDTSFNITTPQITAFTVSPTLFTGGQDISGQITIDSIVQQSNVVIGLNSTISSLQSIVIPAGLNTIGFTVPTYSIFGEMVETITASLYESSIVSNTFHLLPIIQTIYTNYPSITGGSPVQGTIQLSGNVRNNYVIDISTNCVNYPSSTNLQGSDTITILANTNSVSFSLDSLAVVYPEIYTITASFYESSNSTTVALTPSIGTFDIFPSTNITGGIPAYGNIIINGPVTIQLSASNNSISIPSSITIPEGSYNGRFDIKVNTIFTDVSVDIIATIDSNTIIQTLYLTPAILSIKSPPFILGSATTTGTVSIHGIATNDIEVSLTASSPNITLQPIIAPMMGSMMTPMVDGGNTMTPMNNTMTPMVDGGNTITVIIQAGTNESHFIIQTNSVERQENTSIVATLNQSVYTIPFTLTVPPSYATDVIAKFCNKQMCEKMIFYNKIVTGENNPQITKKIKYATDIRTAKKIPVSYQNLLKSYTCGTPAIPAIENTFVYLFNNPRNIVIDSYGTIYVANNDQVIKMDVNGRNKTILASHFTNPLINIAVYGNYLFITVVTYIIRINTDGTNRIILPPTFTSLYGITSDSFGSIYFTDSNTIIRMDVNGNILNTFINDTFFGLYAIDIYNSNIYIVGQSTNNVNGTIRFVNTLSHFDISRYKGISGTIQVPTSQLVEVIGISNQSTVGLSDIIGFSVYNTDTIYISDAIQNTVYRINGHGVVTYIYGYGSVFNSPYDVVYDANHNIYVADSNNNRIVKILEENGSFIPITNVIKQPHGISVDNDQNCYIIDLELPYVSLVNVNGDVNNPTQIGSGLVQAGGIVLDLLNNYIYVCNTNMRNIQRMNLTGSLNQITIDGNGSLTSPSAIAIDNMGNIYITDFTIDSNANVLKMMPYSNTPIVLVYGNTVDPPLKAPIGIAVDLSGNIYVADSEYSYLFKFDATGQFIGSIGSGFYYPYDVAVDSFGYVYVADNQNNRIVRMDTQGNGMISYYKGILSPYSLSVDINQNVYVVTAERIVVFRFPVSGIPAVCAS